MVNCMIFLSVGLLEKRIELGSALVINVLGNPQIKWNSYDLEFSPIGGNLNVELQSKIGSFSPSTGR